jgi:hypothetical protein
MIIFQKNGFQVFEKATLGCKTDRRLLEGFMSQKVRERSYQSSKVHFLRNHRSGASWGRSLSKVKSS